MTGIEYRIEKGHPHCRRVYFEYVNKKLLTTAQCVHLFIYTCSFILELHVNKIISLIYKSICQI